jgi:hypothetical protein
MKEFKDGQRVVVKKCGEYHQYKCPEGTVGSVVRIRGDGYAFIQLAERFTGALEEAHPFEADDPRGKNVIAGPQCCDRFKPKSSV